MADLFAFESVFAMLHGFLGLAFLVLYSGSMAMLFEFAKGGITRLRYSIMGMAAAVWITSLSGLFVYIFYRAPVPGSARSQLLAGENAWIHEVLFEFKEHAGMFPPVIMAAAALFVWHYGDHVFKDKKIRFVLAGLLTLAFVTTMVVFALGAFITKVQPV